MEVKIKQVWRSKESQKTIGGTLVNVLDVEGRWITYGLDWGDAIKVDVNDFVNEYEITYTNSEIMDMMENGLFVAGDKIKDNARNIGVYVVDCDKDEFFEIGNDDHLEFFKGDRWTITLVDRWEECTVQEAFEAKDKYGTDIKSVIGDPFELETLFLEGKSTGLSEEGYNHIYKGTWYKKVSR